MPERPPPDIEHTREALRQHDERVEEDSTVPSDPEPDETEEEKPEPPPE
jgi:hypothetical protein